MRVLQQRSCPGDGTLDTFTAENDDSLIGSGSGDCIPDFTNESGGLYSCWGEIIITGAQDLADLQGVRCIDGDFIIEDSTLVTLQGLESLEVVTGIFEAAALLVCAPKPFPDHRRVLVEVASFLRATTLDELPPLIRIG